MCSNTSYQLSCRSYAACNENMQVNNAFNTICSMQRERQENNLLWIHMAVCNKSSTCCSVAPCRYYPWPCGSLGWCPRPPWSSCWEEPCVWRTCFPSGDGDDGGHPQWPGAKPEPAEWDTNELRLILWNKMQCWFWLLCLMCLRVTRRKEVLILSLWLGFGECAKTEAEMLNW